MGVGCCFLLQGIFPTQGSNPPLLSPALTGGFFTTEPPGKPPGLNTLYKNVERPIFRGTNLEHLYSSHGLPLFVFYTLQGRRFFFFFIVVCFVFWYLLVFSCSVMSDSLQPYGLWHARLPSPLPSPGACSNSCPWSRWCHPAISSSVVQHQGLF